MRVAWLLLLQQLVLVASQIALKIASDAAPNFADEFKEPKYIIGFLPSGTLPPEDSRPLTLRDGNGTVFDCYIPQLGANIGAGSANQVAQQAQLLQQTPTELLDALEDWCAYRVEDWWTYEVCYKRHVRQYHKEEGRVVTEYLLGRYTPPQDAAAEDEVQVDLSDVSGEVKFVTQGYGAGDACEITGQARSTEVRYVCGGESGRGDHVITSIKEPTSCHYLVTVSTPRLCKHPAFRSQPPVVAAIRCIPQEEGGLEGGRGRGVAAQAEEQCVAEGGDTCSSGGGPAGDDAGRVAGEDGGSGEWAATTRQGGGIESNGGQEVSGGLRPGSMGDGGLGGEQQPQPQGTLGAGGGEGGGEGRRDVVYDDDGMHEEL